MNKVSQQQQQASKVVQVTLENLEKNPWNCNTMSEAQMRSLQESMSRNGRENVQPLVVRAVESGKLQIVDGEHRFIAAGKLKWDTLPVIVADIDEHQAKIMSIALNYVRGKMDPTKLFETFYQDWEGGDGKMTTRELEEMYGHLFDQSWIVRILQLRNLAPEVMSEIRSIFNKDPDVGVSVKHLIVISQLKESEEQLKFLRALVATSVSVATLERMVREYQLSKRKQAEEGPEYGQKDIAERKLEDLGLEEEGKQQQHKKGEHTNESMMKCASCGAKYMVNWRRKSVLKLIEEGTVTKATHVPLT